MLKDLGQFGIEINGLFLNVDVGFDSVGFRELYFINDIIVNVDFNKCNFKSVDRLLLLDDEFYKECFLVECINVWIDVFKVLII